MKTSLTYGGMAAFALALVIASSRSAIGQAGALVRLQSSTPGTAQTGHTNITGTAIAGQFSGGGASITGLNASNLASGTVPPGRISGSYNLAVTFSNAGNSFTGNGAGLTGVNAAQLGGQSLAAFGLLGSGNTWTGANSFGNAGNSFTGNGAGLTALNASNLASGALPGGRLGGTYGNALTLSNASNAFTGNGSGLTNVNAAQLGGVAADGFGILNNTNNWGGINNFTHALNNFTGNGAGLVGVDADKLDGIDSAAFLQSVPNPLSLTSDDGFSTIYAGNSSTAADVNALVGEITSASPGASAAGVYGINRGTNSFGYGVYGEHDGGGIGVTGISTNGIGVQAWCVSGALALQSFGKTELNGNVSIGAGSSPVFPLQFASTTGEKVSLFGTSPGNHYGLGIQASTLQIYNDAAASAIAFGYGGSASFNERARFTGSADLIFRNDGFDTATTIQTPYDLELQLDRDNDNTDAWFRMFTDNRTFEHMRITDGDEAPALFDGAVTANGIDFAEAFRVHDRTLEPGDLVVNYGADWEYITRSEKAYDQAVIGVVSTKPSFVAGMSFDAEDRMDEELTKRRDAARKSGNKELEKALTKQMHEMMVEAYRPVAFMGRVPVKVTGVVRPGDHLTSSNIPGVAIAMTHSGQSIGIALEPNNGGNGKIMVMIQPRYYSTGAGAIDPGASAELQQVKARLEKVEADNADLRARLERLEQALGKK